MNIKKYQSPFVKTQDVTDPVTLTITTVEERELGQGETKELKPVLYTEELNQGIVLSAKQVLSFFVEAFGAETTEWAGKKVVLFRDPNVTFQGKRIGGLRFRLPAE